MNAMRMRWIGLAACAALAVLPAPALARQGWNCTYEGRGSDPAHYVTKIERRGDLLVEPHWPVPVTYRILADNHEMLIAARAATVPPSFRRDARGEATVLFINKQTGHMRRAAFATGEADGQTLVGVCERW
ncbi:MAG TPA: hypothetical protein VKB71_08205 [Rhizomicrobium sp.]|nr:hypothetical protein [Rhizomicrobium sp.]